MTEQPKKAGLWGRLFGETAPVVVTDPPSQPNADTEPSAATSVETVAEPDANRDSLTRPEPAMDTLVEPDAPAALEDPAQPARKLSWFERMRAGLAKTSSKLTESITAVFTKRKLDADTLQDLEDVLIQADLGLATAQAITDKLASTRLDKTISAEEVRAVLAAEVAAVLEPVAQPLVIDAAHKPHVVLVVGVNGSGKTTTIGKLAKHFTTAGHTVMLAAGDTFRAAAIDQLKIWGERTGSPVIAGNEGADASGLAFEAMTQARAAAIDVLLIDTAGRLQNKAVLMAELEKVIRVIRKIDPSAPHTVLLVLDATTGQNALNQVEVFGRQAGVTGIVMTKLDGTARGGILVAIAAKYRIPVHFIGVGEGADDLQPFQAQDFSRAIAG